MTLFVTRRGHRIHLDVDDGRAQAFMATNGDLNAGSHELWTRLVAASEWDLILDVGANYGEMLLDIPLPSSARVVAFEPNRALVPYLRQTIDEAGMSVAIVEKALSDAEGQVEFLVDTAWSGQSRLATIPGDEGPLERITVPTTTLDAYFAGAGERRACIKIDVEGAERLVLDGGADFLAQLDDVAMMLEVKHLDPEDVRDLAASWRMYMLDIRTNELVRVVPEVAAIVELRQAAWIFQQDAVMTRRSPQGRRPW